MADPAHLQARIDQLARCVRIQRQALQQIAEQSTEPHIAELARDTLRAAQW